MTLFFKKILREYKKTPFLLKFSVVAIILVRIYLFNQPSFGIDMGDWKSWTARLVDVGPFKFYTPDLFADYLPFYYLFLWLVGIIFSAVFGHAAIFSATFEFYIKAISSLFDAGTAFLIYLIIRKHARKWAAAGSVAYLANPATIFNSSVWGQVDAIPTFLIVYSLYWLEEKHNLRRWSITSALAFLIKPFNVPLLPIMLTRAIKSFRFKEILLAAATGILIFFIITVPFFLSDPFFGVFKHFSKSLSVYPYTSINAYNFWGLFGWWESDTMLWFNISYQSWGYILYALALCALLLPYLKKSRKSGARLDYFACGLSSFAFFLVLTRIHERHLFPVFALLIITACIYRSRVLLACYFALSLVNFANLFYSYYYYNFIINNSAISKNILFDISSDYRLYFSILTLVIFGIMFALYFAKARINSRAH